MEGGGGAFVRLLGKVFQVQKLSKKRDVRAAAVSYLALFFAYLIYV